MSQILCRGCRRGAAPARGALPALLLIFACGSYVDGNAPLRVDESSTESGGEDSTGEVLSDPVLRGAGGAGTEVQPESATPDAEEGATPDAARDPAPGADGGRAARSVRERRGSARHPSSRPRPNVPRFAPRAAPVP